MALVSPFPCFSLSKLVFPHPTKLFGYTPVAWLCAHSRDLRSKFQILLLWFFEGVKTTSLPEINGSTSLTRNRNSALRFSRLYSVHFSFPWRVPHTVFASVVSLLDLGRTQNEPKNRYRQFISSTDMLGISSTRVDLVTRTVPGGHRIVKVLIQILREQMVGAFVRKRYNTVGTDAGQGSCYKGEALEIVRWALQRGYPTFLTPRNHH